MFPCREVSKVIVTYANAVLQQVPQPTVAAAPGGGAGGGGSALYDSRYKGISVCLLALARAMSGNYVNFGVFELYGDPALKVRYGVQQRSCENDKITPSKY